MEVLFYHLERQSLEAALPQLIERCLARDWRAIVQTGSPERTAALDAVLWSWRDDSFLPHGTAADGDGADQPVYLTDGDDNPNNAKVRFLVDGAVPGDMTGYDRVVCLFDGRDNGSLNAARGLWKRLKDEELDCTYWQQNDQGKWEKRA